MASISFIMVAQFFYRTRLIIVVSGVRAGLTQSLDLLTRTLFLSYCVQLPLKDGSEGSVPACTGRRFFWSQLSVFPFEVHVCLGVDPQFLEILTRLSSYAC